MTPEEKRERANARRRERYAEDPHYRAKESERAREKNRKWAAANPEKAREKNRNSNRKHRTANPEYSRKWRAANPEYDRTRRGLPTPTHPCPAVCEACGGPPGKKSLALDHCHSTGGFRGWLCVKCNAAVGMLGDTLPSLMRAAEYLQRTRGDPGRLKWLRVTGVLSQPAAPLLP